MSETIIDGRGNYNSTGSNYIVGTTADNKLMVNTGVPIVITGSVLIANNTVGSTILPALLNTINWISLVVSGNAPGSVYAFGIKDSEGFLIQSLLRHTGDFAFLSPIPASGVLVYTISGTTASGTYFFRTAYI